MKKNCLKLILSIACLFCLFANAEVTVTKQSGQANPNVYFSGINGDSKATSLMKSNLKNCGWFDMVNSKSQAQYSISGDKTNSSYTLTVRDNAGGGWKIAYPKSSNQRSDLYKLTDGLLKKMFEIPGICSSKLTFAVQFGRNKDIYTSNFDGSDIKRITNNNTLSIEPSWGLNNSLIVYTLYRKSVTDIIGKSLTNGKSYRLAAFRGTNSSATVSPSGKYLALILSKDGQVELYVKQLQGSGLKRLTYDKAVEGSPCWSPDNRYICYVSDRLGRAGLYMINPASKNAKQVRIQTVGSEAVTPDWSKASNKIVYSARVGREYTLGLYDVKTRQSSQVPINAAGSWMSPSWAPDGRHVICSRLYNHKYDLYVVDTWTGKARKVINYKSSITSPSWSGII